MSLMEPFLWALLMQGTLGLSNSESGPLPKGTLQNVRLACRYQVMHRTDFCNPYSILNPSSILRISLSTVFISVIFLNFYKYPLTL